MVKGNGSWETAGKVSSALVLRLAMFTGALAGLIFLIRPAMRKHKKVDLKIFDQVKAHTNEKNTRIMSFFTFFGTHQFFIPSNLSLLFYFLFVRKRSWISVRIAAIAISSLLMMFLLKYLFRRKRPLNPLETAGGIEEVVAV